MLNKDAMNFKEKIHILLTLLRTKSRTGIEKLSIVKGKGKGSAKAQVTGFAVRGISVPGCDCIDATCCEACPEPHFPMCQKYEL